MGAFPPFLHKTNLEHMARQKKTKHVQEELKLEVKMSELAVLDQKIEEPVVQEQTLESIKLEMAQLELQIAKDQLESLKKKMKEKDLDLNTRRELDSQEVAIVDKQLTHGSERTALRDKIAKLREYDNVMVTGKFINRRAPGQTVKLPYLKYSDDQEGWKEFKDGGVYTIKRGFADQINEYYHTPLFHQKTQPLDLNINEGEGSQISFVDTSNKKYAFVPVSF